jgi:hypothetical protein
LRLGKANGVGLHWTGTAVELRNSANVPTIVLDSAGNSRFDGPMTIGTAGGIWQALTGTFAAPRSGIKLWNNGGGGALGAFNADGANTARFDKSGLTLENTTTFWKPENSVKWALSNGTVFGLVTATENLALPFPEQFIEMGINPIYGESDATEAGIRIAKILDTNETYARITADGIGLYGSLNINGPGPTKIENDASIGGGLAVGASNVTPDSGAIHLQARTTTVTPWPGGVQLWAQTVNNVQKVYVKFGNGTVRELASA